MARLGFNVVVAASAASGASARRDQRRLALLFLVPVVITVVIGVAMGGYSTPSLMVGMLDRAGNTESRALADGIINGEHMRVRYYTDEEKMRLAVFRGRLNAGIIVPPRWQDTEDLQVYLAYASVGSPVVRAAIDAELSRLARGGKPADVAIRFPAGGSGGGLRLGFPYTAPANLVLFLLINGFASSLGIIQLRRSGISQRLLATPSSTWALFAMVAVGPLQQMAAQAIFLIASARLIFGVHWGAPLGVLLVTASLVGVGVSLFLLMGTIFRTPEQPASLGPWLGVMLGMLGGCMWPLEVVPPLMKTLGHLSPAAWAMDAYMALIFDHVATREILPETGVLLLFAAVITAVGILRLRPQFSR